MGNRVGIMGGTFNPIHYKINDTVRACQARTVSGNINLKANRITLLSHNL